MDETTILAIISRYRRSIRFEHFSASGDAFFVTLLGCIQPQLQAKFELPGQLAENATRLRETKDAAGIQLALFGQLHACD
jgi:hypothetical protein